MPKYYEPLRFNNYYSNFLRERLQDRYYCYIDPDSVDYVGKTDFYNDLTDFLNGREKEYWEKENRKKTGKYYFLPPFAFPQTADWLKKHENMKEWMSENKIAIVGKKQSSDEQERLFCLTSDQFGFSAAESIYDENDERYPLVNLLYLCKEKDKDEQERIIDRIAEYVKNTRTIGGSFLWPMYKVKKRVKMIMSMIVMNVIIIKSEELPVIWKTEWI